MLPSILGDEVELTLGGEHIVLRPTLRAAITAFRMHGGFDQLFNKVIQGDTDTLTRLVKAGAGPHGTLAAEITWPELAYLPSKLTDFVFILSNGGVRPAALQGDSETEGGGGGRMTFEDYFARLLKYGVGWIGWTVEQTLDTPMPAIESAYVGRMDMVMWMFGGSAKSGGASIPIDEKLKSGMAFLGTRKVKRA